VTARAARRAAAAALLLLNVGAGACGKRGNPLPPLRPIPGRVADLTAHRTGSRIDLQFTVPNANTDGTTPIALDRVDVYAVATAPGAPAPAVAAMTADPKNLRGSVAVRREEDTDASSSSAKGSSSSKALPTAPVEERPRPPGPGDRATLTNRLDAAAVSRGDVTYFVAVPVAGSGRGRRGPASAIVAVPAGDEPAAPGSLALDYDATHVTLSWKPAAAGQSFKVWQATGPADPAPTIATPAPVTATTFSAPVVFGRAQCFAVAALMVTGPVTVEGPPSAPACVTPVDRFPPAAPAGLQAVQEGSAVTLIWSAVDAPDLAGYIVLRADMGTETFQPLQRAPVPETTYRDTTVRAGATYLYTVIALDKTGNPSEQSNRQTITVR